MSVCAPRRRATVRNGTDPARKSMFPLPAPTLSPPPTVAAGDMLAALQEHGQADHAARVFMLTARVCRRMRVASRPAGVIALAALYHDVGKIGIPASVLDHPGPLGVEGRTLMRDHPIFGEAMLIGSGLDCLAPLVRHSHERWDGTGYPDGLAGEAIPRGSRIIAACDTWDAMRSDRPYQPARSHEEALGELVAASGTQLEPAVVASLVAEVTRQGLT
jgi:two-component system, cell cycle response regulator